MTALHLVSSEAPGVDPDIEAFTRWQTDLRGLRRATVEMRAGVLERLRLWLGKPLRHVTEGDLLRWEQGEIAGRAPETRRAYVSHVKAFYRWAVLTGVIGADPSTRLTNPKLRRPLPRPIPDDDLRRALAVAGAKTRAMMLLGAFCGLRCQEIAGLHWTDLHTHDGQTTLLVREGKGGKERVVPVPAVVMDALNVYGRRRSGPMFYGRDGRPLSPNGVSQAISYIFGKAGLNYTAHQLRHRYATTAYRLSLDLRMVQELLGHASPQTTARYAAFDQSQTADMLRAMDEGWQAGGRAPTP